MPIYSRGLRLLKGAIVAIDPAGGGRSTIVFQYNPETLKHSLEPQLAGAQGGERSLAVRYTGVPCTINESAYAGRRNPSRRAGR